MAPPLFQVEGLTRRFGRLVALAPTSFAAGAGELVVVTAPPGGGKTTLCRLIAGELRPTGGRVLLGGRRVDRLAPHARCRLGIGRLHRPPRPLSGMTVIENALVAAAFGRAPRPAAAAALPGAAELAASLLEVRGATEDWPGEVADPRARAAAALAYCGLEGESGAPADGLSAAQAARLELARAIAANPLLLVADQPLEGLPDAEAAEVARLFRRIRRAGIAVLACERPGGPLGEIADRVVPLPPGDGVG